MDFKILFNLVLWFHLSSCLNNGAGITPQMAWNSWNAFHCNINETLIKEITDAMISTGLRNYGYKYVNIDDCWAYNRTDQGVIIADPITFPSGIMSLSNYVHSKNLLFGLYSDAGYNTCAGRPGSLGYETIDANTYASWNADYLKYDNCNNDGSAPIDRYMIMRDALNQTNRSIFFSMCEWGVSSPWQWASKVGNSWRMTNDIEDNWDTMIYNWDHSYPYGYTVGPGGWSDPDMLEVGNGGLTYEESKTHFSLWCLGKAPLIIGNDIRSMSSQTFNILTNSELIEVNQDSLGIPVQLRWDMSWGKQQIYSGPLSNNCFIVAVLNRAFKHANLTVKWGYLGLNQSDYYMIRDLWLHENITKTNSYYEATNIPPHGIVVWKFIPV